MFEQEVEMEKQQSGAVPLLLMVALIVAVVGIAGYYVIESRKVLTTPEAANLASAVLKSQPPITVSFHTGLVKEGYSENPRDARYRLLEKAGVITIGKTRNYHAAVTLTPNGEELLKQIPGVQQSKDPDGTDAFVVPLAVRTLVDVASVTMKTPSRAIVEYTWQWEPNDIGIHFDASGKDLASFSSWDRQTLIDKHGVRFYQEAPTRVALMVVKTPQGWQVATE